MNGYLVTGCTLAYAVIMLVTARKLFTRWRPSMVVVRCVKHYRDENGVVHDCGNAGKHMTLCYRRMRPDGTRLPVDYRGEAVFYALTAGLAWPLVFLFYGIPWLVTAHQRELPGEREHRLEQERGELQARIAELERGE